MRCWYTQWQLSTALDRGAPAPRFARRHLAACAACQDAARALDALHGRLAAGAASAPRPAPVAAPRRRPLLVGGAAAAAFAAVALVVAVRSAPEAPPVATPVAFEPAQLDAARRVVERVSQALAAASLESELDALVHDGARGLDVILETGGLRKKR